MTTLYKKGSQYNLRFGGIDYSVDIVKSKDNAEIAELKKAGWLESIPETATVKPKAKAKAKADKE